MLAEEKNYSKIVNRRSLEAMSLTFFLLPLITSGTLFKSEGGLLLCY